jgi:hypothetical protein
MQMEIKYHSKYESEAKELESFLEASDWDVNHQIISVNEDGNVTDTVEVEMTESEEDVYAVMCEGTIVCSNPTSNDEVVDAVIDQSKVWGSPSEGDSDYVAEVLVEDE